VLLLLKGSKVTLCAQKMTKRLITLLVLLSVCHFGKIKCDCDYFFPNGLGRVFKIKAGPQLEPSLKKARTDDVIELNVINGTLNLNLGGNVDAFEAVIGEPPATSSELTLIQALGKINQTSPNIKALISFQPKNFMLHNIQTLEQFAKNFPLWASNEVSTNNLNLMSTLELPNKSYGLDNVFNRVQTENILLPHDFYRMKSILTEAFDKHQVETSQKVYLQRKYKSIKRLNPNSFTDLYVNNLLHLVEHVHDMENPVFLPDSQKLDETCTESDIGAIKVWLKESRCSLLRIRAGIFLKPDCLSILNSFLYNHANVRLLVHAYPHDTIPVKDLVTSLNVIGQNNVLLDLPEVLERKLQALSGYSAVEDVSGLNPRFDGNYACCVVNLPIFSVISALIVYFVMN